MLLEIQNSNRDATVPLIIGGCLMFALSIALVFFPRHIRKYDQRLTRLIKDEEDYVGTIRLMGAIFFFGSIGALAIGILTVLYRP